MILERFPSRTLCRGSSWNCPRRGREEGNMGDRKWGWTDSLGITWRAPPCWKELPGTVWEGRSSWQAHILRICVSTWFRFPLERFKSPHAIFSACLQTSCSDHCHTSLSSHLWGQSTISDFLSSSFGVFIFILRDFLWPFFCGASSFFRAATLQKRGSEKFLRFSLPKVSWNLAWNFGEMIRATFSGV